MQRHLYQTDLGGDPDPVQSGCQCILNKPTIPMRAEPFAERDLRVPASEIPGHLMYGSKGIRGDLYQVEPFKEASEEAVRHPFAKG